MSAPEVARLLASTDQRWDCSGDVPVLRQGWLRCGFCGGDQVQVRFWRFHRRPAGASWPYRCDVSVKCRSCAAVWPHGLAVSVELWRRQYRPRLRLVERLLRSVWRQDVGPTIWERDYRKKEA